MSSDPMVGQDAETQRMVEQAKQADAPLDEALQAQADAGPGREAAPGEGAAGGVMESVKGAASSAVDSLKQMNPATRDTKEPHC